MVEIGTEANKISVYKHKAMQWNESAWATSGKPIRPDWGYMYLFDCTWSGQSKGSTVHVPVSLYQKFDINLQ